MYRNHLCTNIFGSQKCNQNLVTRNDSWASRGGKDYLEKHTSEHQGFNKIMISQLLSVFVTWLYSKGWEQENARVQDTNEPNAPGDLIRNATFREMAVANLNQNIAPPTDLV